ncbi:hypothetical protein [Ruminiclostridium papyrosolvens]|uniref:Uncharacterized protein n=1 Tax=Ruminiclostridium papyrosolvens C7 TaxID=1330534 RepID=U4QYJ2_9FIRM|nr:hypothetical protein [Ruminiclostridium papyrosolvens]EPR09984.1 hypothetical protein L323_15315 [Ruminiclostridium papyrosolvens C7]
MTKNIKIFFKKPENEPKNLTYNYYGVTEIEYIGDKVLIYKGEGEEKASVAILNWSNVNQIVEM